MPTETQFAEQLAKLNYEVHIERYAREFGLNPRDLQTVFYDGPEAMRQAAQAIAQQRRQPPPKPPAPPKPPHKVDRAADHAKMLDDLKRLAAVLEKVDEVHKQEAEQHQQVLGLMDEEIARLRAEGKYKEATRLALERACSDPTKIRSVDA